MRYVLLPFFIVYLGLSLSLNLAHQAVLRYSPLSSLLLSGLFLLYVLYVTGLITWPDSIAQFFTPPAIASSLASPPSSRATTTYQTELEMWLQLAQLQPTHRDILINIARLYQALDRQDLFQLYWSQAQQLDPNNAAFK